jgi:hypothetical protein
MRFPWGLIEVFSKLRFAAAPNGGSMQLSLKIEAEDTGTETLTSKATSGVTVSKNINVKLTEQFVGYLANDGTNPPKFIPVEKLPNDVREQQCSDGGCDAHQFQATCSLRTIVF